MARAAGIVLTWDDFDELSQLIPLLARVYPNGEADVNRSPPPVARRSCSAS